MEESNSITSHIHNHSSFLYLPRHSTSKIENLVQYTSIPDDVIVEHSVPPLISPYNTYRKYDSLTKSIRSLLSSKNPAVKEYIQSSKMDHFQLPASNHEQYATLTIPHEFIEGWKREGYSHLHLGAVRLVLSYHGRKGLPISTRVSLLDTRFTRYEHAIVGTILTTLNGGSNVVTFFPNFVLSLCDSTLATAFNVQVQITGAEQTPDSIMVTLHHQIVYRLQNHSLDLKNQGAKDSLIVIAQSRLDVPTIIQVPRQISRKDLEQLIPTEWITNYESLHQTTETIQSTKLKFQRLKDEKVKTIFKTKSNKSSSTPMFQLMVTPAYYKRDKWPPIHSFCPDGYHVYTDKIDGHFLWDIDPSMCDPRCPCKDRIWDSSDEDWNTSDDEDEEYARRRRCHRKKNKKYNESSGPLATRQHLSCYKKKINILKKEGYLCKTQEIPSLPVCPAFQPCFMFRDYAEEFPPFERQKDKQNKMSSRPYIQSLAVDPTR